MASRRSAVRVSAALTRARGERAAARAAAAPDRREEQ